MSVFEKVQDEYRNRPMHGIQFSIEAEAYLCRLGDRVMFGDNTTEISCGTLFNYQDILLDGKCVGYLTESQSGRTLDPMCVSFCVPIADCSETDKWEQMEKKFNGNPHLCDNGETLLLKFATLNQLLDYLKAA